MPYRCDTGDTSPWGEIQHSQEIAKGFYQVDTAGHGGIMVERNMAMKELPAQARKIGFYENGYYCFEEDTAAAIPFKELLMRKDWQIPRGFNGYSCTREEFEQAINEIIREWYPEYYEARKNLFEKPPKQKEIELER